LASSAADLRRLLADNGITTVLIGAHAANRYRLEVRHTVEDVIIHKLIAGRPRDLDDIRSILSTDRELDESYILENARQWDVIDRWEAISGRGGTR
jgi:hypothetical protein